MKKLIAYGVVPVAVVALLAGCNGSEGESSTTEDGKAKLEVLAVLNALTKDLNDIPYMNDSQEMADVEIEWTQVRSGWDEQKNPILASGDLPDIFISAIGNNDIMTFTNQFLPLGDLIEEHAPNIKKNV